MGAWIRQNALQLIGPLFTLVGIIAGALTVVWQLQRQHKGSLVLQRENKRQELKLQIYQTLVVKMSSVQDKLRAAWMYAFLIPGHIEIHANAVGYKPQPLEERSPKFSELHNAAMTETIDLLIELESWWIAFPGPEVFQLALNSAIHNAREAFTPLSTFLLNVLPMDVPPGSPIPTPIIEHPLLSGAQLAQLKLLVEQYREAMTEIVSYVHDMKVEAQNNLLSNLFDHRTPRRKPLDPRYKVITTDAETMEELKRYFTTDTPWGKQQADTEKTVTALVAQRGGR